MLNTSILTNSGKTFNLAHPRIDLIDINDIAWSLARLQRFNGHANRNINVATHSIWMAEKATNGNKLDALLHDAAEAYTGDITRPMKNLLGAEFEKIETEIQTVVAKAFGLQWPPPEEVLMLDNRALVSEMILFVSNIDDCYDEWDPEVRMNHFLKMFDYCCQKKREVHPGWKHPRMKPVAVVGNE